MQRPHMRKHEVLSSGALYDIIFIKQWQMHLFQYINKIQKIYIHL